MFDQGVGKETPIEAIFPKRGVEEVSSTAAIHKISPQSSSTEKNPHSTKAIAEYQEVKEKPEKKRQPARFAHQIMVSPVITLPIKHTVKEALALFHTHGFRHMPVIDESKCLVGIVSDRDFLTQRVENTDLKKITFENQAIEVVMKKRVLTATEETEIRLLAAIMCQRRIGAIPIVNEQNHVIGIVSRSDILRTLINQVPIELWT